MCSVDTDGVDLMTPATVQISLGSNVPCRKCNSKPIDVVLRKSDPYCKSCFLAYITHKFRSCIGKHKTVSAGTAVLVAVNDGMSSVALMNLLHAGVSMTTNKKLRIVPTFLHVDVEGFMNGNENGSSTADSVCRSVLALGYPCYYFPVEAIYNDDIVPVLYSKDDSAASLKSKLVLESNSQSFTELLQELNCPSAEESLIRTLTLECLKRCCVSLGFKKMFVGTSAAQIAATILSNVALGRGAHVPEAVGFQTEDPSGFDICRPMREILEDEISHYLALENISYRPKINQTRTIMGCTQSFLSNLQENYPSTVPTVFRTGDKLLPYEESSKGNTEQNDYCKLCHGALDTVQPDSSALEATLLSQTLSNMSFNNEHTSSSDDPQKLENTELTTEIEDECNGYKLNGVDEDSSKYMDLITQEDISSLVCYGCRIILKNVRNSSILPQSLLQAACHKVKKRLASSGIEDLIL